MSKPKAVTEFRRLILGHLEDVRNVVVVATTANSSDLSKETIAARAMDLLGVNANLMRNAWKGAGDNPLADIALLHSKAVDLLNVVKAVAQEQLWRNAR